MINQDKTFDQISDALENTAASPRLNARWNEISIEENYVPKGWTPEVRLTNHLIGMVGNNLTCELRIDGHIEKYPFGPNEFLIIPAGQGFTASSDKDHISKGIHISETLLKRNSLENFDTDNYELVHTEPIQDPLIVNIQNHLCVELKINPDGCEIYAQTMANALAVHLLSRYSAHTRLVKTYSGGLAPKKLKLVTSFINDNLEKKICLKELANLVHMSQYHFGRAFKQSLGISPHQYLIQ